MTLEMLIETLWNYYKVNGNVIVDGYYDIWVNKTLHIEKI